MKRLPFKPIWELPIKEGQKTGTTRWRDLKLKPGEIVSATTRKGRVPGFLIKASEGFCFIRITQVRRIYYKDYDLELAQACGFKTLEDARAFYSIEKPDAGDLDEMFFYGFELIEVPQEQGAA